MTSYADLLRRAVRDLAQAGIPDARLDAEILLAEARALSRASVLAHLDDRADDATGTRYTALVSRRARHEPVAYITGRRAFYGLDFAVDRRVLIPRPETEMLVEAALAWLATRLTATVFDVGTGSGAIAVALAAHTPPGVRFVALDISPDALTVARENAARHDVAARIEFRASDLLGEAPGRADLIVANLPYVSRTEWPDLTPDIVDYEPRAALDGGLDGLDAFRRFFMQAPAHLAPGGALMLEIGWTQASAASALAQATFPAATISVRRDGAGLDRLVIVQTPNSDL